MKKCELCNRTAMSYCESDDACLCWECDAAVHHANFLTAKHLRVVLCRVCQDPTRWVGSGVQLDSAARACSACADQDHHDDDEDEDEDDVISDGSSTDEESDDDTDDDQVVPTPTCIQITTQK